MTGSQPAGSPPQWTYGLDLTVQGVQSAVANIAMPGVHWHVRAAQALFWICTFDEQFHQVPATTRHATTTRTDVSSRASASLVTPWSTV